MRFENSFIVWETREDKITLKAAIKIARRELIADMVYDPLGISTSESWWWCVAVLEVLQQEDFIREFEIIEQAPMEQEIESKEGAVY